MDDLLSVAPSEGSDKISLNVNVEETDDDYEEENKRKVVSK